MQDSYGRNINYLRLSITDSCNYRCVYCMDSDDAKKRKCGEILSTEELINIGKAAVNCGINKIRITGGEPLLRKDILSLCEGLKDIAGLNELALTTNGTKLSEMARELKSAGVDRLNISLDTLKEDRFKEITRTGGIDEVLNGIDEAINAGFKNTKINVVLMSGVNDDEINDFVNITKDKRVSVRFIELMPIGPSKNWYEERFMSTNIVLEKAPELKLFSKDGVANIYKPEGALGTVGLISPVTNCFCDECNRLRITADGRLLPCLHSDMEYNVRGMSNKELIDTFYLAIKNKPRKHHIVEKHSSDNSDYMNNIGG